MATPFKTFRGFRRFSGPRWQTDGEGGLVGYALDLMRDALAQAFYLAQLVRFPQQDANGTPAPADALAAMGRDRLIYRGIFETDTEYAARLKTWLTEHATRGNPFTLMRQIHAYVGTTHGVSFRTVDVHGNWYSRSATGVETSSLDTGNWNWDGDTGTLGDTTRWSRFWVIAYAGTLWSAESTWGAGLWGDTSGTWGATATTDQAASLRALMAGWKPDGTRGEIILALDGATFDPAAPEPDGHWGKFYFGADAPPHRLATARYFGA